MTEDRQMIIINSKINIGGRLVILNTDKKIIYKSEIESFPIRINKEILEETNIIIINEFQKIVYKLN